MMTRMARLAVAWMMVAACAGARGEVVPVSAPLAPPTAAAPGRNAPAATLPIEVSPWKDAKEVLAVWPEGGGKMPGKGASAGEGLRASTDGFTRVTNVSVPTLAYYPAPRKEGVTPSVVIVCPGGGYNYTVVDKEGTEIAAWLNGIGMSAAVLKYRAPNNREGAFQDMQRAISVVRGKAREWGVSPKAVGVMGFSAGGNLAAKAEGRFEERSYPAVDETDKISCRPDFAVLVYPAYLEREGKIAGDLVVRKDLPPTLIVHSEDDRQFVLGTKVYGAALKEAGANVEVLMYETGGHGYGLRCEKEAKAWPGRAEGWFRGIGVR